MENIANYNDYVVLILDNWIGMNECNSCQIKGRQDIQQIVGYYSLTNNILNDEKLSLLFTRNAHTHIQPNI